MTTFTYKIDMGNRMGRQLGQQQTLEVTSSFGKDADGLQVEAEDNTPTLEPISETLEVEEEKEHVATVLTPDFSRLGVATPFADPRAQHVATYNVKFVHMN
jgi:hypothetical protein